MLRYHYAPSRSGRVAAGLLGDYQGFVQTDGYEGYDRPCAQPAIVHVGCMAHARRGFVEAARTFGKSSDRAGSAQQALALFAKLYRVESLLREQRQADPDGFVAARRERVEPVLDKLHALVAHQARAGAAVLGARQGGALHVGAVAEADPVSGVRALDAGHQRVRAGDPAVRRGPQELVVLRQSAWGGCQRGHLQHHRDRQGQRP